MSFFDDVEREVKGFVSNGERVVDYRLALAETVRSELGLEANRLGSPYAPLGVSDLSGGSFLVRWTDGTISRGSLSRAPRDSLREVLASAFAGRYEDQEEANFPEAAPTPDVALFSAEVAAAARGESPEVLPRTLDALKGVRDAHEAAVLDASVEAVRLERRVVSSGGFRADSESTRFSFSVALDSLVWDGFGARELYDVDEVLLRAERTAADYESLREEAGEKPTGMTSVILHPRVAEQFLRTFLFSNLGGAAVANGRSRFVPEDFKDGKCAFREDLSLAACPVVPLSIGSFCFTDEGVPAREFDYIRNGRLVTPGLSLKYARRLEMEPTASPGAIEGYRIELDGSLTVEEAMASLPETLIVHAVMGLHTQDAVRGEYSLLAPQGVIYRAGRAGGRVSVTLNGSFFEDLAGTDLRLVEFPGFHMPGLLLRCELS